MKQIICDFKENQVLKLYITILAVINIMYLYFEALKSQYVQGNLLEGTIEMHQFEYLTQISKVTSFLEFSIILIYLAYLIKVFIKRDKLNIKQFSVINFSFLIFLTIANFLVSVVFSVAVGNVTQQLFIPYAATVITIMYVIVIKIYKRISKGPKTAEL